MEYTVKSRFDFGDEVYLKSGSEDSAGQVVGFKLGPGYVAVVLVQWGKEDCEYHYDFELSREKVFAK